jgi:hypothetical protein
MAELAAIGAAIGTAATTVAPYAMIGGTILGGLGTLSAYSAQRQAASSARMSAFMEQQAAQRAAAAELAIGEEQLKMSEFRAKQFEMKGQEERAAGAAKAADVRKQKELGLSRLRARAAAGGGSATDPTVLSLAEGLDSEGEHRALTEFYLGESAARGNEDTAMGERLTGQAQYKGAINKKAGMEAMAQANLFSNMAKAKSSNALATSTLLTGAGSLFDRFTRSKYFG